VNVVRGGRAPEREQFVVARAATLLGGIASVLLGIVFEGENVAYMVGLAFAIAASANFPALVLSIFWRAFTTRGAQASMIVGTLSALVLIFLSPTIQVSVLGRESAFFPLRNPGLVTIPLSFLVGMVVSILLPESEASGRFAEVQHRVHLGPEADGA
jgi:cation/acetate symporter